MEYQITPEQGKELSLKLQAVSISLEHKRRMKAIPMVRVWHISIYEGNWSCSPHLKEVYRQVTERVSSGEEVEEYFAKVAPQLYVRVSICPDLGFCHILQNPWPSDFHKIYNKMVRSDNFIASFENAIKIGMNVYLSEEEQKNLEDCLYPVDKEYVESVLSEVESITYYEEQDIIDIFNSIKAAPKVDNEEKKSYPSDDIIPIQPEGEDNTSCVAGIAFVVGIVVACIIAICL